MYDLDVIRQLNNEHTDPDILGKAMTHAEIQEAARQEELDGRYSLRFDWGRFLSACELKEDD